MKGQAYPRSTFNYIHSWSNGFLLHFLGIGIDKYPSFLTFAMQPFSLFEKNQSYATCYGNCQHNQCGNESGQTVGYDEADNGNAYRGSRPIEYRPWMPINSRGRCSPLNNG